MTLIKKHLVVYGRVQGVGFRHFVTQKANRLEMKGWVRNRRDGTVEAVVAGKSQDIEQLLAEIRKGPPASSVSNIEIEDLDNTHSLESDFTVKPTV